MNRSRSFSCVPCSAHSTSQFNPKCPGCRMRQQALACAPVPFPSKDAWRAGMKPYTAPKQVAPLAPGEQGRAS